MKCARLSLAIVALLVFAQAWAQSEDEGVDSEQDFEHPGADVAVLRQVLDQTNQLINVKPAEICGRFA